MTDMCSLAGVKLDETFLCGTPNGCNYELISIINKSNVLCVVAVVAKKKINRKSRRDIESSCSESMIDCRCKIVVLH